MDTPIEEQQMFQKVTCNIAASEDEITEPDMLSANFINYVSQMFLFEGYMFNSLYYPCLILRFQVSNVLNWVMKSCKLVIVRSRLKYPD